MIPTLAIGDYIFVNKFAYGLKIPFTDWLMDAPVYVMKRQGPQRGDVIVFRFPKDESIYFIKRVVGLPGDTIEMRDKVLFINGKQVPRDVMPTAQKEKLLTGEVTSDPQYTVRNGDFYIEHLPRAAGKPGDHMMMIDQEAIGTAGSNYGPTQVPADSYFALGDNRDVSHDSRFWGFVPMKNVAGRAMGIWFSFWAVSWSDFNFYFHPKRIGGAIQ